jgi:hypothetical protein
VRPVTSLSVIYSPGAFRGLRVPIYGVLAKYASLLVASLLVDAAAGASNP